MTFPYASLIMKKMEEYILMDVQQYTNEVMDLIPSVIKLYRGLMQKIDMSADCELTPTQMRALITLQKFSVLNMSQLSENLEMQKQHATKIVDALVNKGYVIRKADPSDRRSVLIELSDDGQSVMEKIIGEHRKMLENFFASQTQEQQDSFYRSIMSMKEIISFAETNYDS